MTSTSSRDEKTRTVVAYSLVVWTDPGAPGRLFFATGDEDAPFGPYAEHALAISCGREGLFTITDITPDWPGMDTPADEPPHPWPDPVTFARQYQGHREGSRWLWIFDDDDPNGGWWQPFPLVHQACPLRFGSNPDGFYRVIDWHNSTVMDHESPIWSIGPGSTVPVFMTWPIERRQQVRYY